MKRLRTRREFITTAALGSLGALGAIRALGGPSAGPAARLDADAVSVALGSGRMRLLSTLPGFGPEGAATMRSAADGSLEVGRAWTSPDGHRCSVLERFTQGDSGELRWTVEVRGEGAAFSAPIRLSALYPAAAGSRFWTAWSDPGQPAGAAPCEPMAQWADPLVARPFCRRHFFYGAPAYSHEEPRPNFTPVTRDLFALPLASILEAERDTGISLVVNPESGDGLLDLEMDTDDAGRVDLTFLRHRVQPGRAVRLEVSLVTHEADWRGGLRWMTGRYPRFFNPSLALADELDGTAAYSTDEARDLDRGKLERMAFRVNWKASFDFPYMGMFLPPVKGERWDRFYADSDGHRIKGVTGDAAWSSNQRMAEYSKRMRAQGFYVLNYFNATEFGADIAWPPPAPVARDDADLWRNANDFLYGRLRGAIVHVPKGIAPRILAAAPRLKVGAPFYTWGDGICMDCADPAYEAFLLDQAREHVRRLPASSGLCIDRMDWLRFYNEDADDGVSWLEGGPARSLCTSWRGFMAKMLPLLHGAGKVVFVNNLLKRVDLLRDIDGIYDEFAAHAASLNLTALLSVRRPALGWTDSEDSLRPDPDAFLQRFLYLGVFPTAPFPGNDHCIGPSPWAEQQYLAYGPLMNALRGRTWVLEPHAVRVPGGEAVANAFRVGSDYAFAVMLGGSSPRARVSVAPLSGIEPRRARVLVPGAADGVAVSGVDAEGRWVFDVPLARGCALLQVPTSAR